MNLHTVIHKGRALQTVSAILYTEERKKNSVEGCDQGRVHREATETQKTKKKLVCVKKTTTKEKHSSV